MERKRNLSTYYKYFLIIMILCLSFLSILKNSEVCYAESTKDAE